mmetsp:Transcript_26506/g.72773  ORF Transcript_26506/g.72773 Transcript_26506/m.72773 type:complete len:918 (-) Transcript_26506:74-2827(-)|eukprot:CAMPEP_0179024326 /NCGR_PEP_ID=MMETSP0796-20121207/7396_1 /TAXON_ID=73915 /ORGANISM="Pyrodinium bahamense, Strain pbaha01" /LENGTH=917 /DNA_ID=CAMNT_0020720281 /DNA_START=104 /DNA_END=2857 /DNA_ORIENTATION=+
MAEYQKMEDQGPMEPPFALADLDNNKEKLAKGLTTEEAKEMVAKYGLNEVPEEKEPLWKMFLKQFTGPMQIMIECAALLCLSIQSWPDFIIIMVLLMTNGILGFFEEKSAQASVDALKAGLQKKMPVKRDGVFNTIPVLEVVPGDILFMRGGDIIPADCYWLSGDACQADEAALTGESLPVKVPRKDDSGKPYTGRRLWSGAILKVGECEAVVSHTGVNTMIGEAAKAIQEAGGKEVGVFEGKIISAAKVLIGITVIVVCVLFIFMYFVQHVEIAEVLEMSLSLVIASVPVALPMVMKVTLSIGAKEMADEGGIVTHLTALEEVASMKVLCSDKTGTLTTAKMTVYYDSSCRTYNGFTPEQVLEFASIASNDANKDDPIDSAVLRAYMQSVGAASVEEAVEKRKEKFVLEPDSFCGFNPIVKRTSATVRGPYNHKYFCAKGMVDVILKTDPSDEGVHQWEVENYPTISQEVHQADATLGVSGFKTLGVMVKVDNGPAKFAGILPIMDPPRHDTRETIAKIKGAHVAVKMITGDHHNIGKELARQIDLGTDIRTPDALNVGKDLKDEIILHADGFAKVKPLDKHAVVSSLQDKGMVVGMTGDGVNDAPALAKAQIGIAVHGATDAAKSAGDIVLTKDGLSPIYTAIQISRRIFKRLKSYVIYRICITVQVVFFLAALALFFDLRYKALYIILLALFHDLQIVTIAYDKQVAGPFPETPTVMGLLMQSYSMGILMFVQTMVLIMYGETFMSDEFKDSYHKSMHGATGVEMDRYLETAVFLQISNSSAILILSARTVGFFFSSMPAWQLLFSTVLGQVLVNGWILFFAGELVSRMQMMDVVKVWIYDLIWLLILDLVKMTAEAIWDKIKPKDIEHNPALAKKKEQQRMSRRATNSLMVNAADLKRTAVRQSGRVSVRVDA